ncbi:MAG TPA: flagellar basal body-associated FliL family protein [Nocardioides sp.]|uniref:Flagellar protein FliL n=1 Tax=Nocardioides daedukensis TaxID=634462 RepID=A0A7Y9S253_9ACTN|nr:flagellar basal body-associated FliL family protein [Nocardioides daedukensis]NYG58728.1 flagellar FliL protein [Nocardioides daedukensis]
MTMTALPTDKKSDGEADETPKSSKKKTLIIALVVLLALGGGAWQFFLKPAPSEPAPGEVLPLTAIQVNLAGGHYLRIGLALQLVEGAEEADGSKALDAAIEIFSGQKVSTVTDPEERDKLKDELTEAVREAYHEEVLEVYYTDFVTQ